MRHHRGVCWFGPPWSRTPTLLGAPLSTRPAKSVWSSWSWASLHGRWVRLGSFHQRLKVLLGVVLADEATWSRRRSVFARTAGSQTHTMRTVDNKGSDTAGSTSWSSAVSRSSSSRRCSQTSCSTGPGGGGVHHLRVRRLRGLALGPDHALQGGSRDSVASVLAAEGL